MKAKCSIIEDLLPLYIDGVCSDDSKALVEKHLKECMECREKYQAQKSEIILDEEIIKDNLKAKKPFKKIKHSFIIKLILISVSILILFLFLMDLRGDGIGFGALHGRYKAERVLSHIEKGEFERAAKYVSFTGGKYKEMRNKEDAKKLWVTGMQQLKNEGIEIISHSNNDISTDDGFTSGHVVITVKYKDFIYDFTIFIATNTLKVELGRLYYDPSLNYGEENNPIEVGIMLTNKIQEVMNTYDPG